MHWIGLMSGTSLDGLDIVSVEFTSRSKDSDFLDYSILASATVPFPESLRSRLKKAKSLSAAELTLLDKDFGRWMGQQVIEFVQSKNINPVEIEGIASHGQTVFHRPDLGYTLQIGCGQALQKACGFNVINDFRTGDILAGGQGAPLVPIGEKFLFSDACDSFLNLGGFSNIGFEQNGQHLAFDISPCNLPLNHLMERIGKAYDENGALAKSGKLNASLLNQLNALPYYGAKGPKSLGTEWLDEQFLPLLPKSSNTAELSDILHTVVEHIAIQVSVVLKAYQLKKTMVTGGGAYHQYLLDRIQAMSGQTMVLPNQDIIEYKEALIFAFLGYRRFRGKTTTLASITGASSDQVTGVFYP